MRFSLDQIDRAFFEYLRLELVAQGYTPDIVVANTKELYETALEGIRTTGKTPVNVYGVGSWNAKHEKQFSIIVVKRVSINTSNIGILTTDYYEPKNAGGFNQKRTPIAETIAYQVTIVAEDTYNERVLQEIVRKALGVQSTLYGKKEDRTNTDENFQIFRGQVINQSGEDFVEYIFQYTTSELYLSEDEVINDNVPAIREIHYAQYNDNIEATSVIVE